jgi:hypothetical protein
VTGEQVMVRFVLAYLGTFAVVAAFFLAVGVLLGYWLFRGHGCHHNGQTPADGVMDVAFSVGVARAAHPLGECCRHGVQFLDECLDCPDGCPQVVA